MPERNNKTAFNLASAFFQGNVTLNLLAIGVLVVVGLLQMVPILGIIFAFAYPILSLAVQVYVAKAIPDTPSPDALAQKAKDAKVSDLFTTYLDVAAGGFVGLFTIAMVFMILFMLLLSGTVNIQAMQTGDMQAVAVSMMSAGALGTMSVFMLIAMFLGYVFPGVMGEVVTSSDFGEAFKKSFYLLSPAFWKRTFNGAYFKLVFIWSIVVFVAALVLSWIAASILLLPVALVGAYFLALYNAAVYRFAKEKLTNLAS